MDWEGEGGMNARNILIQRHHGQKAFGEIKVMEAHIIWTVNRIEDLQREQDGRLHLLTTNLRISTQHGVP